MENDPMHRFPPEISATILLYASSGPFFSEKIYTISSKCLLELTCISSSWMNLIISTPVLWTDIVLDVCSTEDALAIVAVHLTLSRSSPLFIIFPKQTSGDQSFQRVFDQLSGHTDRIQSLYVDSEFTLSTFYQVLGPLRNLTFLRCRRGNSYKPIRESTVNFINCHSGLKEIQNVTLTPTILKSRWSCRLSMVTTSADVRVRDLIAVPGKFSALKTIVFHPKSQRNCPPGRVEPLSLPSCTQVRTWDLKMSGDDLQLQQDMDIFLSAVSDSLETLKTRLDIEVLPLLLPRLAQLQCLQRVVLDIVPTLKGFEPPVLMPPSLAQVLVINISGGRSSGWSQNLVAMVKSSFPHVKQLTLGGWRTEILLELLSQDTLSQLTTVSLGFPTQPLGPSFSLSSTIQKLTLDVQGGDINQCRSTNVTTLNIHYKHSSSQDSPPVDLSNWPNLKALQINRLSYAVQWHIRRFEFLRKIDLGHSTADLAQYEGSRLIYHLAAYPEAFPSLRKLKLQPYIEWDIFFIMLESRNSSRKTSAASRIKSVTFTSRIPGDFADLISKLLQGTGEDVDSLSKFSFSWMGNMDIIQDMSLPGCRQCHKSLLYCKTPWVRGLGAEDSKPPPMSAYETENDKIISTWPSREEEWASYVAWQITLPRSRSRYCQDIKPSQVIRIRSFGHHIET